MYDVTYTHSASCWLQKSPLLTVWRHMRTTPFFFVWKCEVIYLFISVWKVYFKRLTEKSALFYEEWRHGSILGEGGVNDFVLAFLLENLDNRKSRGTQLCDVIFDGSKDISLCSLLVNAYLAFKENLCVTNTYAFKKCIVLVKIQYFFYICWSVMWLQEK